MPSLANSPITGQHWDAEAGFYFYGATIDTVDRLNEEPGSLEWVERRNRAPNPVDMSKEMGKRPQREWWKPEEWWERKEEKNG